MSNAADQTFETIRLQRSWRGSGELRKQGYRLVQIGATRLPEHVELTYSFDLESRLTNLRLPAARGESPRCQASAPSTGARSFTRMKCTTCSTCRWTAWRWISTGNLYETTVKFPFGSTKAPVAKPAPAAPRRPCPARNHAPPTAKP